MFKISWYTVLTEFRTLSIVTNMFKSACGVCVLWCCNPLSRGIYYFWRCLSRHFSLKSFKCLWSTRLRKVLYCEALEHGSVSSGLPQLIETSSNTTEMNWPRMLITTLMTLIPKWYCQTPRQAYAPDKKFEVVFNSDGRISCEENDFLNFYHQGNKHTMANRS